jgi:hypothetical protein
MSKRTLLDSRQRLLDMNKKLGLEIAGSDASDGIYQVLYLAFCIEDFIFSTHNAYT